jgi:hypothetical protein
MTSPYALGMSLYSVATTGEYEGCSAECGWDREVGGYWVFVTDERDQRVTSGGLDAHEEPDELKHLLTLFDLVEATNGIVDWLKEDLVLRRLRDDAWADQVRVVPSSAPTARLLSQTFGSVA